MKWGNKVSLYPAEQGLLTLIGRYDIFNIKAKNGVTLSIDYRSLLR